MVLNKQEKRGQTLKECLFSSQKRENFHNQQNGGQQRSKNAEKRQ